MLQHPLVRVTLLGAVSILAFTGLVSFFKNQPASWPDEQRLFTYIFIAPLVLLGVMLLGWLAARQMDLRFAFVTGAVLPLLLVLVAILPVGLLLSSLQIDPVHGYDGWAGWLLVAIGFYPAMAVWYLSPAVKTRLTVFGTVVAMLAAMVFYSWTARERWRHAYWAKELRLNEVSFLDVPGFQLAGMRLVKHASTSPAQAVAGYTLRGTGAYEGALLYVESSMRSGRGVTMSLLPNCGPARPLTLEDRAMCLFDDDELLLTLDGTVSHVFWKDRPGRESALVRLASAATIHRWSIHDLRYIPVGGTGLYG
ncbi:hypothetical protein [Catelliglobosispora koreensis]|uniref:hypothetical protein n=1 Tax=Catelliglobosispora koreensis TaxID=129052 RepID=UPI00036C1A5D|nr:hypothetical protein [Catelliglobosispora koreensis]